MTTKDQWMIFIGILILLITRIFKRKETGDYSMDLERNVWIIVTLAYILVWGGIFWW